jgi:hypothetical protein
VKKTQTKQQSTNSKCDIDEEYVIFRALALVKKKHPTCDLRMTDSLRTVAVNGQLININVGVPKLVGEIFDSDSKSNKQIKLERNLPEEIASLISDAICETIEQRARKK